MNPAVDRQLRRAARAFPRQWRRGREDELVATAAEMLPADATTVPFGVQADIVRAGWSERWRAHPPVSHWLWYCAGGKLPAPYHPWLHQDLDGPLYWLRTALRRYVILMATWLLVWTVLSATNGSAGPMPWDASIGFLVMLPVSWASRDRFRRQVRKQHGLGVAAPGSPLPPPAPMWMPARAASVALRPLAFAFACFGAVATILFLWRAAALDEHTTVPRHTWIVTAVAAVVGVGGAVAVRRRAARRLALLPTRPALKRRDTAVRIGGALALSAAGVAFWLAQLEQSVALPNPTLFAALGALLTVVAVGAALTGPGMTAADLLASEEQLAWLQRQELVAAG